MGTLDIIFPTRDKPFVVLLDGALLIRCLTRDLFPLRGVNKAGDTFGGHNGSVSLFHG